MSKEYWYTNKEDACNAIEKVEAIMKEHMVSMSTVNPYAAVYLSAQYADEDGNIVECTNLF